MSGEPCKACGACPTCGARPAGTVQPGTTIYPVPAIPIPTPWYPPDPWLGRPYWSVIPPGPVYQTPINLCGGGGLNALVVDAADTPRTSITLNMPGLSAAACAAPAPPVQFMALG